MRALPWGVLVAGVLLLLGSWYFPNPMPAGGTDPSWQAGLHRALHDDLAFGTEMVFTYGPLGFLKVPSFWYVDTGLLALAYRVVTHLALLCVLYAMARRSFNPVVAFVMVLIAGTQMDDAMPILAFAVALHLVLRPPTPRATRWVALVAGLVAGEELLGKANTGVTIAALLVVALLGLPGRPWARLAIFAGGATVSLLVLWVAIGEPLGALDDFALNSARIISGYSVNQAIEDPARAWEYGAALIVALAGTAGIWLGTAAHDGRARLGALGLWAVLAFLSFKASFVRHDQHSQQFFAAVLLAVPAFFWPRGLRLTGLLVFAVALTAFVGVSGQRVRDMVTPVARARVAVSDLRFLLQPERVRRLREAGRTSVRTFEVLDSRLLALLRGHTVHVLPTEAALPWAFFVAWRPLPVMQGYQAYTPGLDHLNATALTRDRAPERVLLNRFGGLDGRFTAWDEPETTRELLCRYRPALTRGDWLVLTRGANRCGTPRLVGSSRATWGQPVTVPAAAPGTMVYVRIAGASVSGFERLRSLIYKAYERSILIDGKTGYRLQTGTATDGLIVQTASGVDWPAGFGQSPQAGSLAVDRQLRPPDAGALLRYDFYAVDVAGTRPARARAKRP